MENKMLKSTIYSFCLYLCLIGFAFGSQNDNKSENRENGSFKKNSYKEKALEFVKKNDKDALLSYLDNVEIKNDPEMQTLIGCLHYEGELLEHDDQLAIDWWKKAALQGNESAQIFLDKADLSEEKLKELLQKATQNHLPSLKNLALRYFCGAGVEKDEKQAFEFYEKAASLGSLSAQCELAKMYFQGQGIEKNLKNAFIWWEKAAKLGCAESQMHLAIMYVNGEYVEQDMKMAQKYLESSANQGLDISQYKLSKLYEQCGRGTSYRKWLKKSADQGYDQAKQELKQLKETDEMNGGERSGEYLNPGHVIYSFSSEKMECQTEIDSEGYIFVSFKSLDKNTHVKFSKIDYDKKEKSILINFFMYIKEDTDLCAGWVNQHQVNINMHPNLVKKASLKGTKIYEKGKIIVLFDKSNETDIDSINEKLENLEKVKDVQVDHSKPRLNFKISRSINWNKDFDEDISEMKQGYSATLTAENFPKKVPLILICQNLLGEVSKFELFVDQNDQLCIFKYQKPFTFFFQNVMKGEPFDCILKTKDGKLSANATIIPWPIEKRDENGHILSLRLTSPSLDMFELNASGFEPKEEIEIYSESEGEKMKFDMMASDDGKIRYGLFPGVKGKSFGKSFLEIKGKTTKDLKVKYKWGLQR